MKAVKSVFTVMIILVVGFACSDKKSEKELFEMANQYMGQQNWQEAEQYFGKIYQQYPNGIFSSKALFMMGYINANHLNNLENARKYYQEFLDKYPDHDLADDAQYELTHLGKNADELPFLMSDQQEESSENNGNKQEIPATN